MKVKTIRRCLLVAAAAAMLSTGARAQTVDIPYQGWLTQGDQPCNGDDYEMVFKLYNSPTSTNVVWSNTYNQVNVSNGAFSVVLPVPEGHVIANEALYLEITVQQVPLVNRQRIYPAMYAARGEMGVDEFWVRSATGSPGLAITDGLRGHTETLTDVSEISNDTGAEGALVIAGNKSADGTRRKVKIFDDLTVDGSVSLEGGTFRGLKWKQDPSGNILQYQVSGTASNIMPYDESVDMGVAPSDGMCILTSHNEAVTTVSVGNMAIVQTRCNIFLSGTPETWHLRGRAACGSGGAECFEIGIYCLASCVLWNW